MKDLRDSYIWDEKRKILTYEEMKIKGLRLLGHDMRKTQKGSMKQHYHKNAMEITYVVQGMRTYSVGSEDYFASGGEAYVTFIDEPHSVGTKSQGFGEYFWIQIEFDDAEGFLGLASPLDRIMYDRLRGLDARKIKLSKQHARILERCMDGFVNGNEWERSGSHILFLNFINELLENEKHGKNEPSSDIKLAIDYINKNVYNNIEFEDLAKASGLSVSGLKHKFGEQVGMPPMQFLNYTKVEEAKRLIESGMKFNEISERLGFSSNSHFASVFRKIMSISPSEYKSRLENMGGISNNI